MIRNSLGIIAIVICAVVDFNPAKLNSQELAGHWEYQVIYVSGKDRTEKELNYLAKLGWELVMGTEGGGFPPTCKYILKRRVK